MPNRLTPLMMFVFHDRGLAGVLCIALHAIQGPDVAGASDSIASDTNRWHLFLIPACWLELHLVSV